MIFLFNLFKILYYFQFIMLKIFVSVLLIVKGITASDSCNVRCNNSNLAIVIGEFPETNKDLQKICKPYMEYIKCEIHKAKICQLPDPRILEMGYRLFNTILEVCSEETLLHAAFMDNLKCWNGKLRSAYFIECGTSETQLDRVRMIAKGLIEKGLVYLAEDSYVHSRTCLGLMKFYACQSFVIERECGAIAMATYVEILLRVRSFGRYYLECEETYPILRAYIRLHKAEEEEERSVEAFFRNMK